MWAASQQTYKTRRRKMKGGGGVAKGRGKEGTMRGREKWGATEKEGQEEVGGNREREKGRGKAGKRERQ